MGDYDIEAQLNGTAPGLPTNGGDFEPSKNPKEPAPSSDETHEHTSSRARAQQDDTDHHPEVEVDSMGKQIDVLRQDLRSIMRMMKLRAVPQGRQQAQSYNESARGEVLEHDPDSNEETWTKAGEEDDVFIGLQAENLPFLSLSDKARASGKDKNAQSDTPWRLFHPFKRGMLNFDEYAAFYGDAAEHIVLGDVQTMVEKILLAPTENTSKDTPSTGQLCGLGIERRFWPSLTVTLVVSDLFSRRHIKLLANLLLKTMGFAGLILQCEAVAACYGAGVSSATVINLGAEMVSISCVDEGVLVPESRILLNYGGNDVSRFLTELLRRAKMPYAVGSDPGPMGYDVRQADRTAVDGLKARSCTLWPNDIGLRMYDFSIHLPEETGYKFSFRMYDETILAPLMLFFPRVVRFDQKHGPWTSNRILTHGEKRARALRLEEQMVEDSTDLTATEPDTPMTNAMLNAIHHLLPLPPGHPRTTAQSGTDATPPEGLPDVSGENKGGAGDEASPAPPTVRSTPVPGDGTTPTVPLPGPVSTSPTLVPPASKFLSQGIMDVAWEASKSPLDVGIWASMVGASSTLLGGSSVEDRVKKMAQNLLCVGGSAHLPGLAAALEARVATHIESGFHALAQEREIALHPSTALPPIITEANGEKVAKPQISPQVARLSLPAAQAVPAPRDMDPAHVAWKGAAVMTRLESIVSESRVRRQEWEVLNWRAVRERTLFL